MLTEDTDATRIPKADNTIVKAPNSKIKKNIYEVFGFICIILLIASCYMSGVALRAASATSGSASLLTNSISLAKLYNLYL